MNTYNKEYKIMPNTDTYIKGSVSFCTQRYILFVNCLSFLEKGTLPEVFHAFFTFCKKSMLRHLPNYIMA